MEPLCMAKSSSHRTALSPSLGRAPQLHEVRETPRLSEGDIEKAISGCSLSRCPFTKGIVIVSESTHEAFPVRCKRWSCSVCGRSNAQLAGLLIEAGINRAADTKVPCRYAVFTAPGEGMTVGELQKAWKRLIERLRSGGYYESYATSIEIVSERPHTNVVLVGGKALPKGRLAALAENAGFGQNTWIASVGTRSRDARNLAEYLVKSPQETSRWALRQGQQGFRPVRLSSKWWPCGLTEGRLRLRELLDLPVPEGPFVRVRLHRGRVRLTNVRVEDMPEVQIS